MWWQDVMALVVGIVAFAIIPKPEKREVAKLISSLRLRRK